MSNLWFNIRFGNRHLQIGPDGVKVMYNAQHEFYRKNNVNWKWFEIYCWLGVHQ